MTRSKVSKQTQEYIQKLQEQYNKHVDKHQNLERKYLELVQINEELVQKIHHEQEEHLKTIQKHKNSIEEHTRIVQIFIKQEDTLNERVCHLKKCLKLLAGDS